jgi:GNAT superfamily N-acetyltransferase
MDMTSTETIAINVTTTSLEMHQRPDPVIDDGRLDIQRALVPNPSLNRFLYATIGADWLWYTRLGWTHDQWRAMVEDPAYQTWIAYFKGSPSGYFELDNRKTGEVEIAYFGLMPEFVGFGLGQSMIAQCVQKAWDIKATKRVWVHTDTCDHPRALPNYIQAGFQPFNTITTLDHVPAAPLQPWPGADRAPATTHPATTPKDTIK